MDDDLLKEFINESREHLATIETDLLVIEEAGADIDEDLVNKVFRAAHSIKGGSGFFGLTKIKELAHKAETVLDMVRSRSISPNAEITNILLAAFDKLREMINNPAERDNADITELVMSLTGLASSYLPADQKASLTQTVSLQPEGECLPVTLPQVDLERAKRSNQYVYCVGYDLIQDIERQGRNVLQLFKELEETGEILDCRLNVEAVGTLEDSLSSQLPLRLVFGTAIDPNIVGQVLVVPKERIKLLLDPYKAISLEASSSNPSAPHKPELELETANISAEQLEPPQPQPQSQPPAATPIKPAPRGNISEVQTSTNETLRVSVELLDTLTNLAGELVLSRNQLRAAIAQNNAQLLAVTDQRLNQVTSELQDAIMRTRLQPIGNVFGKFPRVVRDMANSLHKDIQLDIQGKDVALDRSLIEGLSDPLTHMVRNSVDHGIESPMERIQAVKKSAGTIRIEARHEAGQVVVEIADDGKGIDPKRVVESALAKELITPEKIQGMSDQDKLTLILLPGLSTSDKVTDISGRGVGMDVVKTNLDRLGGKLEIQSEIGKGTLFRIKLPLTLAIIPSLILSVGNERFAIPQINVEELLRIRAEDIKRRIEVVGSVEVLLLRDKIVPLVRLDSFLGLTPAYQDFTTGALEIDRRTNLADRRSPRSALVADSADFQEQIDRLQQKAGSSLHPRSEGRRFSAAGALDIVVVTTGSMQYGLVVDSFHNTEEIVVKPLGSHLKRLREYAGATILGDGTVALILDVAGLAAKIDLAFVSDSPRSKELAEKRERERFEDVHSMLLFHNAPDEYCAIPLDSVQRIERVIPEQVETAGRRRTIQYRGASLPLVTLSDAAQVKPIDGGKNLAVIVSHVYGREVGLLGAMPVDVIETKAVTDLTTHRQKGVAGSAIILDRTTLIADLPELVDAVYPEWHTKETAPAGAGTEDVRNCVLLAEDSDFFRAQVKRYLEEDGFEVLEAPDGEAAWDLLSKRFQDVRLVITDIEMPRLTGLGLAQRIRSDARTAGLPVIALSSLAGEDDIEKGKAVGIDEYQVKLDREKLLESAHRSLGISQRDGHFANA
jgi:two-component system, chemotaxis family, sensor kinase CheA